MANPATPAQKAVGVGCVVVILAVAGLVVYACSADEALQQAAFDRRTAITKSAVDLAADWNENEVAAAHAYTNKSLIVTGEVTSISADGEHPVVKLDGLSPIQPISLILTRQADALPLRPGDIVVFDCVGSRKSVGEVMLDSCSLDRRGAPAKNLH